MKKLIVNIWAMAAMVAMMVVAGCVAGCRGGKSGDGAAAFDREVYTPEYAEGFDIRGAEGRQSVLITVRNPWQGADSVCTQLLVVRGDEDVPDGYEGQVLKGDARRIVAMSTTHVAFLDALGETDRVVGVSGLDFITNSRIQSRRDSVADVGFEGNVNYETLMALEPDLVLLYGVSGASMMEGKLRSLGIPYMYIGEYLEQSPLGKAEWIVAVAEAAGIREKGAQTFAEIPARYNAMKAKASEAGGKKPKVMLNTPYNDTWFMPSVSNYVARLIADAGGDYIYSKNTGNASEAISLEEAYLLVSDADVWINLGQAASQAEVAALCPKFTDTPVFRRGDLYNANARTNAAGGNDFFESAVARPDLVLRDLVKIFHPELVEEDFVYYKQLK